MQTEIETQVNKLESPEALESLLDSIKAGDEPLAAIESAQRIDAALKVKKAEAEEAEATRPQREREALENELDEIKAKRQVLAVRANERISLDDRTEAKQLFERERTIYATLKANEAAAKRETIAISRGQLLREMEAINQRSIYGYSPADATRAKEIHTMLSNAD